MASGDVVSGSIPPLDRLLSRLGHRFGVLARGRRVRIRSVLVLVLVLVLHPDRTRVGPVGVRSLKLIRVGRQLV